MTSHKSLDNIAKKPFLSSLRDSKIAKGITTTILTLALSTGIFAENNLENRKTRTYQVPHTRSQFIFDVTNHQLRNVSPALQTKYENALAKLFKLGPRDEANQMLMEVMDADALDGKIDNFEIVKHYVDSDDPVLTTNVFMLEYTNNHYDFKTTPNPNDPAYIFGLGYGALKLNKLWSAKKHLTKALEQTADKHNKAMVHNYLGNVHRRKGDGEKAIEHYKTAIKLRKNYLAAHFNLGSQYYNKGKHRAALKEYQKCLKIDPNHKKSKNNVKELRKSLNE